jgi:RNA polymerase sigma-70 factor (ECF subfamily)
LDKESDEEIVIKIMETGEHKLFGILYDRYNTKVYHKCMSFAKNNDDAQDMLHDVFLKTFTNLSRFSGNSSFSTWLYSITYNFCVDYARKKKNMRMKDLDSMVEVSAAEDEQNEKELLSLRAERLVHVLDTIGPNEKAILLMKYQDGSSIQEITTMLSISESAVKMRVKRAKAHALEVYKELYTDENE